MLAIDVVRERRFAHHQNAGESLLLPEFAQRLDQNLDDGAVGLAHDSLLEILPGLRVPALAACDLRLAQTDLAQHGGGQALPGRQVKISRRCRRPIPRLPGHAREIEGRLLVVRREPEQDAARLLRLLVLPRVLHLHAHEGAQDRLALVWPQVTQVPAQDRNHRAGDAGLSAQTFESAEHLLVGGREAERAFQPGQGLFRIAQLLPADLRRLQQMPRLLACVLGYPAVPCPARQCLHGALAVSSPQHQLGERPPRFRGDRAGDFTLDAGRQPA
jgi:hypothetical protein